MIHFPNRASRKRSRSPGRPTRRRRILEALESRQLLASLSGDVWSDLNADGQRDPTEPGAANVRVYVDADDNGQFDDGEAFAFTNVLGQYVLNGLSSGTHVIGLDLGEQQTQTAPRTYFGTGYTSVGTGQGQNPTQLFSMTESGEVKPIGQPTSERIHGLIRTNDGTFYGVNFNTDAIYTIDAQTGLETVLSTPGPQLTAGLAYDPATDKIYTVGRQGTITNVRQLYEVSREDGSVTPIGTGLTGLDNISDLTFDTTANRIVGFDNSDDEFFAFDTAGNGVSLSKADRALNSWSLAYNGTSFVMFDQDDPEFLDVLQVNPDTGETQFAFEASTRIPAEALFFATSGNVTQRVSIVDEDVVGIDFGVIGESDDDSGLGGGPALGGLYLNELMIDPLFGNLDTDQFIEIRGDKGAAIPDNTYLVIVDDDNSVGSINRAGEIHGIFDLSNQVLGPNGFLVLLEAGAPYPVDAEATVLRSTETGFGGLPGDIYSDLHTLSERIDFIVGNNTFFLIQSDVPPVLGADIDVGDDGIADPDGVIADWNIFDSISLHPFVGGSNQAYGQIVMVEEGLGVPDPLNIAPDAELVIGDGFGYIARVGDSIGSTAADWVMSTVRNEISGGVRYGMEAGIFGIPTQPAFQGRDLDHVGESNFVGGVRGHVVLEPADDTLPPEPAPGVTVFADVNGNGIRDNLLHIVDPDDFPAGTHLINSFPGVTINSADINNEIVGFDVTAEQQTNFPNVLQNRIFAKGGIDWFPESSRLRFDFYRPANSVSIVGIADDTAFRSTYIRLDAYDADDNLLDSVLSNQLISSSSQELTLSFVDDVIAYAVAYADESVTGAAPWPFGRLDRFSYRQFEASDVTNTDGFYEISPLFPDTYQVTFENNSQNPPLLGAQAVPITVTRYENFVLGPNDLPVANDLSVSLDENSPQGTIVGTIEGSDGVGPVTYSIADSEASQGIVIDELTGELTVGPDATLDFETTPEVVFQVGVTDLLSATTLVTVTVSLNDLNEAPLVTNDPFFLAEDTEAGTAIGQIQATDPDIAQNQQLTFEVQGGSGVGILAVDPLLGIVTLVSGGAIDFESQNQLELIVLVSDDGDPSLSVTIVQEIQILDSNDPPSITTSQIFVNENAQGEVGRIEVSDADTLQSHQFILVGGTGIGVFNIEGNGSVVVRAGAEVNFEENASYTLVVTVVDGGAPPLSDSAEINITVLDINEPPRLDPNSATLPENSAAGTLVATISVIDPEGNPEDHTISLLEEGLASNFVFDSSTGELSVAEGAVLDFESNRVHELLFEITDTTGESETTRGVFTVELTDENDAPRVLTQQLNVSELAAVGTAVGEIRVSDVDFGDNLSTQIVGGTATALFRLDADSHVVTVAAPLDAESMDGLTLDIQVTDSGGLSATQTVVVVLNDVNEPPVFGDTLEVPQATSGVPFSFTIPDGFVTDPEGGEFDLSVFDQQGLLPAWLVFNPQSNTLSGMPNPSLVGVYALTIRAYEPGPLDLFSTFSFDLNVIPGSKPFNNQRNPLDVDDNSFVVASDALRVLNYIGIHGAGPISTQLNRFTGFVDVNGDGNASALDALKIINALAINQLVGEAETVAADDDWKTAVDALFNDSGVASLF